MIYLMEADGAFDTIVAYQEDDASAVAKLKRLIAPPPHRKPVGLLSANGPDSTR
jgi:hypothetical protein